MSKQFSAKFGIHNVYGNVVPKRNFSHNSKTLPGRYSDALRAGRSANRVSGCGRNFRTRPEGPWANPTSYTMGTVCPSGGKAAGLWN